MKNVIITKTGNVQHDPDLIVFSSLLKKIYYKE